MDWNEPNKALQATAALLCGRKAVGRHSAVVAAPKAFGAAAVAEPGR